MGERQRGAARRGEAQRRRPMAALAMAARGGQPGAGPRRRPKPAHGGGLAQLACGSDRTTLAVGARGGQEPVPRPGSSSSSRRPAWLHGRFCSIRRSRIATQQPKPACNQSHHRQVNRRNRVIGKEDEVAF
ncbi:hypothetical protein U9M48_033570 [Paspalum notatum var. saurae]|uniref:Uncharacterized protein n=1 Tax=Paspalum notatum var. saurae TaxID=547442 RepID=A0AAQ3X5R7_PASNO